MGQVNGLVGRARSGRPFKIKLGKCCNIKVGHAPYLGLIATKGKSPKKVLSAYHSWTDQISRCYRPKTLAFKYYGAKGIKVCYTARHFIAWYLTTLKKFKGSVPSVDRIDRRGHYCFCNVRLLEHRDNALDGLLRGCITSGKMKRKPVQIVEFGTWRVLRTVEHALEAEKVTGVLRANINTHCRKQGNLGQKTGITFRYPEPVVN